MPPVEHRYDLIAHLIDMGMVVPAAMGVSVIPYYEIEAWQRLKQVSLTPWEVGVIRRMSSEYAAMAAKSGSNIDPPYTYRGTTDDEVSAILRAGMELIEDAYKARKR